MVSCILRTVADLASLTCGLMGFTYEHLVSNLVLVKNRDMPHLRMPELSAGHPPDRPAQSRVSPVAYFSCPSFWPPVGHCVQAR